MREQAKFNICLFKYKKARVKWSDKNRGGERRREESCSDKNRGEGKRVVVKRREEKGREW